MKPPFGLYGTQQPQGSTGALRAAAARLMWAARTLGGHMGVPVCALMQRMADGSTVQALVSGGVERACIVRAPQEVRAEPEQKARETPPRKLFLSKIAWWADGFLITPRDDANPKGRSALPPKEDPLPKGAEPPEDGMDRYGLPLPPDVPDGFFPHVFINRYKHNNDPDFLLEVYGDKEGPEHLLLNVPLLHMDYERDTHFLRETEGKKARAPNVHRLGIYKKGRLLPQFCAAAIPWLSEAKATERWYCHRAELRNFTLPSQRASYAACNAMRAQVGKEPDMPPLKAWSISAGMLRALEMRIARNVSHTSQLFRAGHERDAYTNLRRCGEKIAFACNLAALGGAVFGNKKSGQRVAQAWRGSPGHYASIIADKKNFAPGGDAAPPRVADVGALPASVLYAQDACEEGQPWKDLQKFDAALTGSAFAMFYASELPASTPRITQRSERGLVGCNDAGAGDLWCLDLYSLVWPLYASIRFMGRSLIIHKHLPGKEHAAQDAHFALAAGLIVRKLPLDEQEMLRLSAHWKGNAQQKKMREASYKARIAVLNERRAKGEEEKEMPLLLQEQARFDEQVLARTLEVVRSGKREMPPFENSKATVRLLEGSTGHFYHDKKTIAQYDLPKDFFMFYGGGFSKSGEKCFFAYSTLVREKILEDGKVDYLPAGEKIHFIEFANGAFDEVKSGSITVFADSSHEMHETGSDEHPASKTDANSHVRASGTCPIAAAYRGEELVFAHIEVNSNSSMEFHNTSSENSSQTQASHNISLRAALVWPDGTRLEYTHTDSSGDTLMTTGFVRQLVRVDVLNAQRTVYAQYSAFANGERQGCKYELFQGIDAPRSLKSIANTMDYPPDQVGLDCQRVLEPCGGMPPGSPLRAQSNRFHRNGGFMPRNATKKYMWTSCLMACCVFPYDLNMKRRSSMQLAERLGPYFHTGFRYNGVDMKTQMDMACSGDEWIFAGRVFEVFGNKPYNRKYSYDEPWLAGDDQYVFSSSMNLPEITGMKLHNNIMPIMGF